MVERLTGVDTTSADEFFRDEIDDVRRRKKVLETVLSILGIWLFMRGYFRDPPSGNRRIILALAQSRGRTYDQAIDLDITLPDLITCSNLLPYAMENRPKPETATAAAITTSTNTGASQTTSTIIPAANGDTDPTFGYHSPTDDTETLTIDARLLNAVRLISLGAVKIHWTDNLSRHLLLSSHGVTPHLELFALPHLLEAAEGGLKHAGIPGDTIAAIRSSYLTLFNPVPSPHTWLMKMTKKRITTVWMCPCLSCESKRLTLRQIGVLQKEEKFCYVDEAFQELVTSGGAGPRLWTQDIYAMMWPRIKVLETHLSTATPWSFWVIFRDRRSKIQYWTFL